jgi:hypothetical protein
MTIADTARELRDIAVAAKTLASHLAIHLSHTAPSHPSHGFLHRYHRSVLELANVLSLTLTAAPASVRAALDAPPVEAPIKTAPTRKRRS